MIVNTELTLNVQIAFFYTEEMNKPLEALITCPLAWLEKSNVYHHLLKHMEPRSHLEQIKLPWLVNPSSKTHGNLYHAKACELPSQSRLGIKPFATSLVA